VMASLVFERLLMRRTLKEGSHLIVVLLTLSAAFLIAGIAMVIWGKQALPLPAFSGEKAIPFIAGTRISPQSLWVMGSTLVMTALLACFFRYTFTGKAMRATADNKMAAILMGVNAQFMVVISFAMSAAAGAIAGMVIAPITFMSYDAGMMLTIKGIVAAVLGGMGSNLGALFSWSRFLIMEGRRGVAGIGDSHARQTQRSPRKTSPLNTDSRILQRARLTG
jgi:branched-chain amino acid transport system permease protein